MKKKIKLLVSNEFSGLETGFSKIGREVMQILHEKDMYEISEVASYVAEGDSRLNDYPWKVYPVIPNQNTNAYKLYEQKFQIAQFGALRFNAVIVEEKPDIVFDMRDFWMTEHIFQSPYRNFYKFAIRPPVDGSPQYSRWIDNFADADLVFSHSRWGKGVLEDSHPNISVFDTLPGGINVENFFPLDKKLMRKKYLINEDLFVILSVCRNQPRKQIPDMLEAYAKFKEEHTDMQKKTVLMLHTSFPDPMGWDIPDLLDRFGLNSDVVFTNICMSCGEPFVTFVQRPFVRNLRNVCFRCDASSGVFPNTAKGVSEQQLNEIYNLADVYVQLASGEGFGVPLAEAKAVGLPVLACPYSAMQDHVEDPGALPIKIKGYYYDHPHAIKRCLPDHDDFIKQIMNVMNMSDEQRKELGDAGREFVTQNYTYEKIAETFHNGLMSLELHDRAKTWDSPARKLVNQNMIDKENTYDDIDNYAFVKKMYIELLGHEPKDYGAFSEYLDALNSCKFSRKGMIDQLVTVADQMNKLEVLRCQQKGARKNTEKMEDSSLNIYEKIRIV